VGRLYDIARAELSMKMLENAKDQESVHKMIKKEIENYAIISVIKI
jgi:hypothetical protein